MRRLAYLAAALLVSAPAFAQGPQGGPADETAPPADPAQQKAVDEAYRDRCEAKASKELCFCVISVADSQIADPAERQIFFDFMMGDVDKAKTARSMMSPQKNMRFNIALQKADVMLGDQCDRLKPKPQDGAGGKDAPQGGQKLP